MHSQQIRNARCHLLCQLHIRPCQNCVGLQHPPPPPTHKQPNKGRKVGPEIEASATLGFCTPDGSRLQSPDPPPHVNSIRTYRHIGGVPPHWDDPVQPLLHGLEHSGGNSSINAPPKCLSQRRRRITVVALVAANTGHDLHCSALQPRKP